MKFVYLLVNFFAVIVPLLFSFHPKIKFYKHWKAFLIAAVIVATIFLTWDFIFTRLSVWSFNPRYIVGVYLFGLPLEEILFFICIPFACIFTYYCLDKFYQLDWSPRAEVFFCIGLSLFLLVAGITWREKLYTSVTFISAAMVCLLLKFVAKVEWFGKALTVYAVLLIPFLIVNGILTGTGLNEPVVIYNNEENLGIRLFTIPVEDVVYGFELILLNLFFYELIKARQLGSDY